MIRLLKALFAFTRRGKERLERLRQNHTTWLTSLYDRKVQVKRRFADNDPKVGEVGKVLSKAEHGITIHPGWIELTPNFGGIRGYHYLVRFGRTTVMMSRDQLAPA